LIFPPHTTDDNVCCVPLPVPFCSQEQPYGGNAVSAYQHFVRGNNTTLKDHVCKEMNELNLERCRCVFESLCYV